MKKSLIILASIVLVFGISNAVLAGDTKTASHSLAINIEQFALLDIETESASNTITLNSAAPTEAGLAVDFSKALNSDLWLNYSSIVGAGKTRSISAQVDGTLPGGTTITVAAANPAGVGNGALGTAVTDPTELKTTGVTIISDIGSCYTGDGPKNGSKLTYQLNADQSNYQDLLTGEYAVTITYTISDEQ